MPTTVFEDDANEFIWQTYERTTRADGTLISDRITFDTGGQRTVIYPGRVPASQVDIDRTPSIEIPPRIERTFENGLLLREVQINSDGTLEERLYSDGVLDREILRDLSENGSAEPWFEISRHYRENGLVAGERTVLDDGVVRELTFQGNRVLESVASDWSADGDARPWEEIVTQFDSSGAIKRDIKTLDNGWVVETDYDDGVPLRQVRVDETGARDLETIVTTFDGSGQPVMRTSTAEDGVTRIDSFSEGMRVSSVHLDPDDARPWSRIEATFDDDGALDRKVVEYDGGLVLTSIREDGRRITFIEDGPPGTPRNDTWWSTLLTVREEDGSRLRRQVFDDGDIQARVGSGRDRVEIDAERMNDGSFTVEVLVYENFERTAQFEYDAIDDVPDLYGQYLAPDFTDQFID